MSRALCFARWPMTSSVDWARKVSSGAEYHARGRRLGGGAAMLWRAYQVALGSWQLRAALPAGVRIGSVDKFQGQEAPVVIVSMCASAGETGGRGLAFVLDQNRLNVALSRAQSLAIVVGDPRLIESGCGSIADMRRLNLYAWIQEAGGMGDSSPVSE
jgi:AAA domain